MSVLMQNLLGSDFGLMSLAVVVITIGIAVYMARMLMKLSSAPPEDNAKRR